MARAAIVIAVIVMLQSKPQQVSTDQVPAGCKYCDVNVCHYNQPHSGFCDIVYPGGNEAEQCECEEIVPEVTYEWKCRGRIPVATDCGTCGGIEGKMCIERRQDGTLMKKECARHPQRGLPVIWKEIGVFNPSLRL